MSDRDSRERRGHQGESDILEGAERHDCEGDVSYDVIGAKGKDDKPSKEQHHGR